MMNAIQEALAPVGQTCVYNRADGFGCVTPTRECGHNRARAQEFQMRNKTFISSMVGVAAAVAVAVAGSANAAIVDPAGAFSNCKTVNPSTSTTITYTGGWGFATFGTFYMGFGVANASFVGPVAGVQVTNIEYSTNSGVSWTLGASSYTTGTTTPAEFFSSAANAPASAAPGTWAFSFTNNGSGEEGGINGSTLRVRATLSATSSIPNDYKFYGYATGQWAFGGQAFASVPSSTAVPAPGALALLGAAGLVGARRRRA